MHKLTNYNILMTRIAKLLWPLTATTTGSKFNLHTVGDSLDRLKALKGIRTIICPNHPSHNDPEVVFELSRMAGEDFYYLTADEILRKRHGFNKLLSYIGCIPIVRGRADCGAFKTTIELIVAGKRKVIVFPEGEVSHQNDRLLPVRSGLVAMGFAAVDRLIKVEHPAPVMLLPLAIKFTYADSSTVSLMGRLVRLSNEVGIEVSPGESLVSISKRIATTMISVMERSYGLNDTSSMTIDERLYRLRKKVLQLIAAYEGLQIWDSEDQLQSAHRLQAKLFDRRYNRSGNQLLLAHNESLRSFCRDLYQLIDWFGITEEILANASSKEDLSNIITVLEEQAFGHSMETETRTVFVSIGTPIDLFSKYQLYLSDRASAIKHTTEEVNQQILKLLKDLDKFEHPLHNDAMPSADSVNRMRNLSVKGIQGTSFTIN